MSTVQVNYKSGQSMTLTDVDEFKVKMRDGKLEGVEWTLGLKRKLRPLFIGVDEIESIWEVDK